MLQTTVTFADEGQATRVRLSWVPVDANAAERAMFASAMDSMSAGWGGSYDQPVELIEGASLSGRMLTKTRPGRAPTGLG